jgi:4-amino-4-deoxy-L-arabinose transferase-like glycosyltransferase
VWLGLGLLVVLANGRLFPHYLTPLLVPLAILAGRPIRHLRRRQWLMAAVILTTLVWGVALAPAPYR